MTVSPGRNFRIVVVSPAKLCPFAMFACCIALCLLQMLPGFCSEGDTLRRWTELRYSAHKHEQQNDWKEARLELLSALELANKLGSNSLYRAVSLRELAYVAGEQKDYAQALSLLQAERPLVESVPNAPLSIDNLNMLIKFSCLSDKEKQAVSYYSELRKVASLTDDLAMGGAFLIAELYQRQGKTKEAITWWTRIQHELAQCRGKEDGMTLTSELRLVEANQKAGNSERALQEYLEIARKGMRHDYEFAHVVKPALTGACTLYHQQNRDDLAEALYSETLSNMSSLTPADRVYLYRRLFDTIIYYGSGTDRLTRATKQTARLVKLGAIENNESLRSEASFERAMLCVLSRKTAGEIRQLSQAVTVVEDLNLLADSCASSNEPGLAKLSVDLYTYSLAKCPNQPKVQEARKRATSSLAR